MSLPPFNFWTVSLAGAPLLLVLYLMMGRRWGGSEAGPAGYALAILISLLIFGANLELLLVAFGRALLLALFVLYIIWMALLLYHVVNEAGAIEAIGRQLPTLAPDRPGQALLLAWVFGSFLQGASGFGVPAAIVAPLLAGLGFAPTTAVVIALLGHGWAVSFGSLGSSFVSLIAATGLPGDTFASESAILLGLACLGCGAGVLWATGGRTALQKRWGFLVVLTLIMAGIQWGLAVAGLWNLAAFGAGLVGLVVAVWWLKPRGKSIFRADWLSSFLPYGILVVIITLGQLFEGPLGFVQLNWMFPEVMTSFGWLVPAGAGRSISLFGHAGALLLYTSLLSYLWFRKRMKDELGIRKDELGIRKDDHVTRNTQYALRPIIAKTIRGSTKSTISILTLIAMAVTMQHAGMTQLLAETLSGTGQLFPFLSPFIGALGAIMTGSNTNSNVVFGQLQQQTALALDLSIPYILAAQTAGGAMGSVFAPAKVIVGCSTVPGADSGQVLKHTTIYGFLILLVLGLLTVLIT